MLHGGITIDYSGNQMLANEITNNRPNVLQEINNFLKDGLKSCVPSKNNHFFNIVKGLWVHANELVRYSTYL